MRCFLIFLSSLFVVFVIIPPIIRVTGKSKLFDLPLEQRKIHTGVIPNAGGIAVFIGFLFSCLIFIPLNLLPQANVLMASAMLIFIMGLKDDIDGLEPYKKLVAQFAAALMIVFLADIRITNLYGAFGIDELSYEMSVLLTIFSFVGVVNAYNLIDGIDGLAGSLGILLSVLYAYLFFQAGQLGYAYLSIAFAGSLIGFLFFNVTPARLFLGDSGSLLIGFVAAVLSVRVLSSDLSAELESSPIPIVSAPGLVAAILVIPVFDTLRVLAMRVYRGVSPFNADSNHLHHRLLSLGLSHIQSTVILLLINLLFIILALSLQQLGNTPLIIMVGLAMLMINCLLSLIIYLSQKIVADKA